jgi:hypothetical protein
VLGIAFTLLLFLLDKVLVLRACRAGGALRVSLDRRPLPQPDPGAWWTAGTWWYYFSLIALGLLLAVPAAWPGAPWN